MGLNEYFVPVMVISGIFIFFGIVFVVMRLMGKDLFGVTAELTTFEKKDTLVKKKTIPSEKRKRIIYSKCNFNELVKGFICVGQDGSGRKVYKLLYGNDQVSSFSIPDFPERIHPTNIEKFFETGDEPQEFKIVDNDNVATMQNEMNRMNLVNRNIESKLNDIVEEEKGRLKKTLEYHREARRTAMGYTQRPDQTGFQFGRPWYNRGFGGVGGEESGEF